MFPNKILQKVSKAEILQNARVGTAVHCLPEWQAPMWVLTGFACYSARKSRSYHAGFRKCSYTCCACYSPFPMLASAISLIGNRRQPPPCLPKSETDGRKSMAAQPCFFLGLTLLPCPHRRALCVPDFPSPAGAFSMCQIIRFTYVNHFKPILPLCLRGAYNKLLFEKTRFLHQVRRQYLWQIVQS